MDLSYPPRWTVRPANFVWCVTKDAKYVYSSLGDTSIAESRWRSFSGILDTWIPGHHRPAIYLVPTRLSQPHAGRRTRSVQSHSVQPHSPWHLDRERSTRSPFQRVRHTKVLEMSSAQHSPLHVQLSNCIAIGDNYVNKSATVLRDADVESDVLFTIAFYIRQNNLACT